MADVGEWPFPRLAISDLLVLTLAVALAVACVAPSLRDFSEELEGEMAFALWGEMVALLVEHVAIGVMLFGMVVSARQRLRGETTSIAPGHWIILAVGPYAGARLLTGAYWQLASVYWFRSDRRWDAAVNLGFVLVLAASVCFATRLYRNSGWRWSVCISLVVLWLATGAGSCLAQAARDLNYLPPTSRWTGSLLAIFVSSHFAASLAALIAVAIDLSQRVKRDWLHYFGVAALVMGGMSWVLSSGGFVVHWWSNFF